MKKIFLSIGFIALCLFSNAQSDLTVLVDSVSEWGDLIVSNNQLFINNTNVGGEQKRVNTTSGELTTVGTFTYAPGNGYYQSIAQDFYFLNGRVSKVHSNTGNGQSVLLSANNSNIDTLLSLEQNNYIINMAQIENKIFVTANECVYTTDLTPNSAVFVDSLIDQDAIFAGSQYFYYVKGSSTGNSHRWLYRTDGITTIALDSITEPNAFNYYFELIGEDNGSFYFSKFYYQTSSTLSLKKINNNSSTVELVDELSIATGPLGSQLGAEVSAIGLGKIYLKLQSLSSPYYWNLYCYNLSDNTFTQITTATTALSMDGALNKRAFSDSYFFFNMNTTPSTYKLFLTDGTLAGTRPYGGDYSTSFGSLSASGIPLFNPHFTYVNKGIICGDYLVAGINTDTASGSTSDVEYHYGTANGLEKINLNPSGQSSPHSFVSLNDTIYFLAKVSTFYPNRISLLKVSTCGMPSTTVNIVENENKKFAIYPSPSNGKFNIVHNSNQSGIIDLYNAMGVKVLSLNTSCINNTSFDISNQTKGMYIAKITLENNKLLHQLIVLE